MDLYGSWLLDHVEFWKTEHHDVGRIWWWRRGHDDTMWSFFRKKRVCFFGLWHVFACLCALRPPGRRWSWTFAPQKAEHKLCRDPKPRKEEFSKHKLHRVASLFFGVAVLLPVLEKKPRADITDALDTCERSLPRSQRCYLDAANSNDCKTQRNG